MKLLRMMIIGILISLSSSYLLVTRSVFEKGTVINGSELFEQVVIAIILGAAIGLLSIIFEWERLTFTLQLLLHLLGVTACVLIAGYFGQWFQYTGIPFILLIEAVIYVIVWCILYVLQLKDIEDINQIIQKRKG
ncbi:DUF3021 family protein [Lysinibacillus sp. FSL H8-0500]|uniref:DUF3021 domain-containing protein n=1 Tax=Lysinibacillus macroides TaxID=33935 RepID=A0A0M9DJR0_9BACI|nr:DUF3021 family protein [Lysinibacillus macroides]KOY81592.1 hypothetical protein ADM90_14440 [Lysinibacillus macroides]QPR69563.1 DUF3021 family protein [Lysinibacillus macroides]